MNTGDVSQADLMEAAAHIRAIGADHNDFAAYHAEALDELLAPMPVSRINIGISGEFRGPKTSGVAAGVGRVDLDGNIRRFDWSHVTEFRCGEYVVRKTDDHEFEIRHVGNVDAEMTEGETMRLVRKRSGWFVYLNKIRSFRLWPVTISFPTYVYWKRSLR